MQDKASYLIHYASEYYDPQKAHEYYEQHKKLKGRTSTAGLNEEGKKVASYVKNNINEQKKSSIESSNNQTKMKIASLKDTIARWPEDYRKEHKAEIMAQIQSLRESNKAEKEALRDKFNKAKDTELEKIANDPNFQATKKSSTKKGGSGEDTSDKYRIQAYKNRMAEKHAAEDAKKSKKK